MVQQVAQQNMQQIASAKTQTAASGLPFALSASALSVQNETRQMFSNEFSRQTEAIRVFEQPRERVKAHIDDTRSTAAPNSANNKQATSAQDQSHQADAQERRDEALSLRDKQNQARADFNQQLQDKRAQADEARANNDRVDNARPAQRDASDSPATINTEKPNSTDVNNTNSHATKPIDSNEPSLDTQHNTNIEAQNIDTTNGDEPLAEAYLAKDAKSEEGFDYIDFVTTVADFTSNDAPVNEHVDANEAAAKAEEGLLSSMAPALSETDLEAMKALLNKIDKLSGEQVDKEPMINIEIAAPSKEGNDGQLSDTITLAIGRDDLQLLIEAKQAIENANENVKQSQMADIDSIIADLAKQLTTLNKDEAIPEHSDAAQADIALLKTLLLSTPADKNTHTQTGDATASTKIQVDVGLKAGITNTANSVIGDSLAQPDEGTSETLESSEAMLAKDILTSQSKSKEVPFDIPTKQSSSVPSTTEGKKPDAASNALVNLADLSDSQSSAALENLTQRIQSVASEISGEAKGNEFIAALQSGLKEFKQQLSQGREPALDLKAIVAEAMAQISGEESASKQPKIDAAVNQFTAVLNLANAVNYSASQQQAQVLGITDNQLAKEINFSHMEGTKLANGIQNQMNAQANADKAINIFKQEGQAQLAEKVRWMVNAKSATAEIRLDPPDLGGINIKINLSGDVAQVNFNVQSQAAKEALDQAVPRLREMLQDQGIELGQSSVEQDGQSGSQQEDGSDENSGLASTTEQRLDDVSQVDDSDVNNTSMLEQRISNGAIGGIDYFA